MLYQAQTMTEFDRVKALRLHYQESRQLSTDDLEKMLLMVVMFVIANRGRVEEVNEF